MLRSSVVNEHGYAIIYRIQYIECRIGLSYYSIDLSYDSNEAHSYKAHKFKAHKFKAQLTGYILFPRSSSTR